MEDDDEFGDLYTDVLRPFSSTTTTSSSSAALQPHQPSLTLAPLHRPMDLNFQSQDDDNTFFGAPRSVPATTQTLASDSIPNSDSAPEHIVIDSIQEPVNGTEVKFDIEERGSNGIEDIGSDVPIIPGLTEPVIRQEDSGRNNNEIRGGEAEAEDDWDSDSEDDLQIVLNDNNHGPMAMERGGTMGEDDDDDDGNPLVIVADGDANQGMEDQEWGEGGATADGERKEGGEAGKVGGAGGGGGSVVAPEIGYINHGYHPFHSQFKYVRPGAAPIPGASAGGLGGAPGQVRPIMDAMAGRGRGDWRPPGMKAGPPMQKGFHPSFGMPGWGSNMAGRGFGGGLEFTLPSHKTIFDVDIDSFEEKPWKYPGVDLSDFFNFGLNEESWKYYCKQLGQYRLETTMQSKIRVYESGRTEQDYDPDLPPELAAATGQEVPADAANLRKSDGGQNDVTKGAARVRPSLPPGRAIQVEGGYGERLPSIDTRPPRIRDSDAIIEIVCQDTLDDDSSTGNGVVDRTENDLPMEDLRGDLASEAAVAHKDAECFDGSPDAYNSRRRELVGRRTINSVHINVPEDDGILPFPAEASRPYSPGSRGQSPMYPSGNSGSPHDERHRQGRAHERSPRMTPIQGKRDKSSESHEEESVESMDDKSPLLVGDKREISVERKDDVDDELEPGDGSPVTEKDELINDTHEDENSLNPMKSEKISSQVEQRKLQELEDDEDSRAARSSENSKARSGSSRDYQKWRDGAEEEVVQGGRSSRIGIVKKHLDEDNQNFWRKDRDGRLEIERNCMVGKQGEDSYPLRDFDASLSHNFHIKMEGFDRRRERDNPDVTWQRREDGLYSRKSRTEDLRKRERDDEMGSRNRAKIRESERSDKDDYPPSRKQLDNGSYKVHHDKDASARHRERDDNLKNRNEAADDYNSKRRKDEEYLRRDLADKEEILHGHRESSSSRRKRERDEILDPRKRDEQQRFRDNFDGHHSVRHKEEVWLLRERAERQRERDEWHRPKQSHEESLSKREREEGRGTVRSGRVSEDKGWVGHTRAKDESKVSEKEYQLKESVHHSKNVKRRDWNDDESFSRNRGREDSYARGHQLSNDERKFRQERSSTRSVNASDSQRGHDKKHKENTRKNREPDGGDPITLGSAKRSQEDVSGHNNEMGLKSDEKNENPVHYKSSRKHREDASSDDEQQESKRGRSKLERWTSHKERDFIINSKSSASSKFKEIEKINNVGSSESNKIPDEPGKSGEPAENHHPLSDNKGVGEPEIKDTDTRPLEDRHLGTVEKLKKRSERFKLPMPKEKDAVAIKKMESEALPSAKNETPADSEIKQERPARKRRVLLVCVEAGGIRGEELLLMLAALEFEEKLVLTCEQMRYFDFAMAREDGMDECCRISDIWVHTHTLRTHRYIKETDFAEPEMKKSTSWLCTLATQLSLCFGLYIVLNLGQPQKLVYNDNSTPLDLYFISVRGGFRPLKEQTHLLKLMENVAKAYDVRFVVNISELGDSDPLLQNVTWLSTLLNVPWYTTGVSNREELGCFLRQIKLPHGRTLDIVSFNTASLQVDILTIFDVDIDSFEEKPWKYPGVDLSDFFNFGLNEESWKYYCKQLGQYRLETTMQSKIRVYESGRTEQDYDPDLPPELAAATGQEVPADAANLRKSDGGQNDVTKGAARVRPSLPPGRAIQVEGGYGERLPSIDTRPPRIRDSDAIIEIVCQDTLDDDSSTGNGVVDRTENDLPMEDLRGDLASEAAVAHKDAECFDGSPDAYNSRRMELVGRRTINSVHINVPEDDVILPFPAEASRPYSPGSRGQSPMYPSGNFGSPHDERHRQGRAHERSPCMTPIQGKRDKSSDSHEEESVESMDDNSPLLVGDKREISVERKDDVDDELEPGDGSPVTEKDELINDTHEDENSLNPMKSEKISSHVEQRKLQELEDDEDSGAARSSENSKARSGSSRDYQKWRDGAEEEVVQGGRSSRTGIVKKHLDEDNQNFRRKDRDGRLEIERNCMVGKQGEDSYPLRDFDASLSHNFHIKKEGFDRRRERDNPDVTWQRREDGLYSRKSGTEDLRKRECVDEMGSRNRAKIRESERSDKDDYPPSRKQLDNGSYKVHHDKDASARHRERDDNLKNRNEAADDYNSKRRKDEEYLRRDLADKEEILHGHRESSSSRRKRERDEILDPHRGLRDSGRGMNGIGQSNPMKKVYQNGREKKDEAERSSTRSVNASDSQRGHDKKHKENTRKNREPDGGDPITLGSAKRSQEDVSGHNNEMGLKIDEKNENPVHYKSSRKHREDASSDDEQQESKRGRSKLDPWTSHKERDFIINSKSSASSKFKEIEKVNNVGSSESNKIPDEPGKSVEPAENHHPLSDNKGVGEPEIKDTDTRPLEDRHLDTVEKLKKRSERFKLPMPKEKDAVAIKKMESEALPSAKTETPADSEIKQERPARKRRVLLLVCVEAGGIRGEELVLMLAALKFEEKLLKLLLNCWMDGFDVMQKSVLLKFSGLKPEFS
ncbi:hypothetical protein REPUB_Repub03eG0024200 [Reevesia pubescens]